MDKIPLEPIYWCAYFMHFVCKNCIDNEYSVIPYFILANWSFEKFPISKKAKSILEKWYDKPIICFKKDESLAILGYNAGPGNINKWMNDPNINSEDIDEFVENIPYLETKAMKDLESVLADQLVLRTVAIPPLHNHVLREFFWDALSRYGYAMDDALVETFYRKLNEERTDGRFYGFRTVDKIAREIVLWKARHDAESDACGIEVQKDRIVPDDLTNYVKDPSAKKTGYDELSELIGMETIRDRIREIVSQVKISMQ